jgi:hypothetical protein
VSDKQGTIADPRRDYGPIWRAATGRGRCRCTSPATARRCTLTGAHTSDHERRRRSGGLLETWPRTPADADHQAACTSADLIGHLSDLIDLAKWEGYGAIVGALERAKREICGFTYQRRRGRRSRPPSLYGSERRERSDR